MTTALVRIYNSDLICKPTFLCCLTGHGVNLFSDSFFFSYATNVENLNIIAAPHQLNLGLVAELTVSIKDVVTCNGSPIKIAH